MHHWNLPKEIRNADSCGELDRYEIEKRCTPGIVLMNRAAQAALDIILSVFGRQLSAGSEGLSVWCGAGNNGGDGYCLARLAREAGVDVRAIEVVPSDRLTGDAATAWQSADQAGVCFESFNDALFPSLSEGLHVDAMLGTGLRGAVRGDIARTIDAMNRRKAKVISLDTPSGLNADTGVPMGDAIRAAMTVTFISLKTGLLTGQAADYVGELYCDDLAVAAESYAAVPCQAHRFSFPEVKPWLPVRQSTSHKGTLGHLHILAGSNNMPGALVMALQSASRIGVGLLSASTLVENVTAINAVIPNAMISRFNAEAELGIKLSALVCGPGLGTSDEAKKVLFGALSSSVPTLLDADALNLLAEDQALAAAFFSRKDRRIVITPHPGEASRLLGWSVEKVEQDRLEAVLTLVETFNCCVLLKGAGTLIAEPHGMPALISAGNAGLATGGMGDTLSGLIGGLLSRGLSPYKAAVAGAVLHCEAADLVRMSVGMEGMLPDDLLPYLWRLANGRHGVVAHAG